MAKKEEILVRLLLVFFMSFIFSLFITRYLIKKERKKHIGQAIKDDIVPTHQKKKNTPTMGGIAIFISAWLVSLIIGFPYLKDKNVLALLLVSGSFFLIGFVDDYLKIKKKNGKGLSALVRILLEVFISMGVLWYLGYQDQTLWRIHFLFQKTWKLSLLFIPFIIFIIVGGANSMNMADGLDGLASGLAMNAYFPFVILAILKENYGIALFLLAVIGGILGFLCFNFHPAKIFMGDVGSLPLGATLAFASFILGAEFLLLIAGGLLIIETLSVILQVISFKLTHRRIFRMAPLHHHFEMQGFKEWQVVMMFYIAGFVLSILATYVGVFL